MKSVFTIATASYDDASDTLVATAHLTRDVFETEIPLEESTERFTFTADFSARRYTVDDVSTEAGDSPFAYSSLVMMSFLNELESRYAECKPEDSPIAAFEKTFTFTVNF